MFPSSTTIQILELRVNELSIDLLQEQQVSDALGELVEDQCDIIAELRNKITALEAIIAEDAKVTNDAITQYWIDNYVADNVCWLCGSHGIISLYPICTPSGFRITARTSYCICPNGQELRKQDGKRD